MSAPAPSLLQIVLGRPCTVDDPVELVRSAFEHRLGGVVLGAVQAGLVELPSDQVRVLAAADLEARRQNQALWDGLGTAMAAASTVGVTPVSIKGAALEHRWYSRLGERPCLDVDLLVPPDELARLDDLLEVWGVPADRRRKVCALVAARGLQQIELHLGPMMIDLHFDLVKVGPWVRATSMVTHAIVPLEGAPAPVAVLDPALELVALATHLNKDRFAQLGAHLDIVRVAEDPALDWDLVHRFVDAEGLQVPVYRTLASVGARFERRWPLPDGLGLRGRVWDRLWPEESHLLGAEGRRMWPRRQWFLPFLLRGRTREAVADLRRRLFPSKELLEVQEVAAIAGSQGRGIQRVRRVIARRRRQARNGRAAAG